jgi:hypothetical protein
MRAPASCTEYSRIYTKHWCESSDIRLSYRNLKAESRVYFLMDWYCEEFKQSNQRMSYNICTMYFQDSTHYTKGYSTDTCGIAQQRVWYMLSVIRVSRWPQSQMRRWKRRLRMRVTFVNSCRWSYKGYKVIYWPYDKELRSDNLGSSDFYTRIWSFKLYNQSLSQQAAGPGWSKYVHIPLLTFAQYPLSEIIKPNRWSHWIAILIANTKILVFLVLNSMTCTSGIPSA